MPSARRTADDAGKTDEPAEPRLSACEDASSEELVWTAPDDELDHVLVALDGEN
jgi:hypothetical protein